MSRPPTPPPTPGISRRTWFTFLAILLANFLLMRFLWPSPNAPIAIPYTAFKEQVAKGNVASIYSKGESIDGRFDEAVTWPPADAKPVPPETKPAPPRTGKNFVTTLPAFVDPGFEAFLIGHGVEISAVPIQDESPWATLLLGFGPAILIIGFYVWMYRRAARQGGMGGALMGIGQSKARRYDEESATRVTFDDVAGI